MMVSGVFHQEMSPFRICWCPQSLLLWNGHPRKYCHSKAVQNRPYTCRKATTLPEDEAPSPSTDDLDIPVDITNFLATSGPGGGVWTQNIVDAPASYHWEDHRSQLLKEGGSVLNTVGLATARSLAPNFPLVGRYCIVLSLNVFFFFINYELHQCYLRIYTCCVEVTV